MACFLPTKNNKKMKISPKLIAKYDLVIASIERKSRLLEVEHHDYMKCKKGCSMCCVQFRIFNVERAIIHRKLRMNGIDERLFVSHKYSCRFLVDGKCAIYEYRPVMCRTHGFPLLYYNVDRTGLEFSSCELNFKDYDLRKITDKNSFPMEEVNEYIGKLNLFFVAENKDKRNAKDDFSESLVEW